MKFWLQFALLLKKEKKKGLNSDIYLTLDQGQWVNLTFDSIAALFTHLVDCIYQLKVHREQ